MNNLNQTTLTTPNTTQISNPILTFPCFSKHIFQDSNYTLNLYQLYYTIGNNLTKTPKYYNTINLQHTLKWNTKDEANSHVPMLLSFAFPWKNKFKEIHASHEHLLQLKQFLKAKIIFLQISTCYEPVGIIGTGSSGKVIKVQSYFNNKYYASKCVNKQYIESSEEGINALYEEIIISKIVSESNYFPKICEFFEGDQTYYIIMELLKGSTLSECLYLFTKEIDQKLKEELIRSLMRQLLEGVDFLHKNQVMHRDLKPNNIMISKSKDKLSVKIIDLGLSIRKNNIRYMFPKCGTPGYVAPEVINLEDKNFLYSEKCDLFSVGSIFFLLLTGQKLFPGNKYENVLKLNKECKIDFDLIKSLKFSQHTSELLIQLLQTNPEQRISAADALKLNYFTVKEVLVQSCSIINDEMETGNQICTINMNMPTMAKRHLSRAFPSRRPSLEIENESPFLQQVNMDQDLSQQEIEQKDKMFSLKIQSAWKMQSNQKEENSKSNDSPQNPSPVNLYNN